MPKPNRHDPGAPPQAAERATEPASPLADSPALLVRLAQLRAFEEFHRHFAGLGITPAGFSVLALVVANPGIRPGAIAEELRMKPSNVAALVNALAADGLVVRSADAAELRASLLTATARGKAAWEKMAEAHARTEADFLARLEPDERLHLVSLLRKLLHR